MPVLYDIALTPEQIEEALATLKRVENGIRSSRYKDAVTMTRSLLLEIHHSITVARRGRDVGRNISD
jgi:hypothetical protein